MSSVAGAALSVACLGVATLVAPSERTAPESGAWRPGARFTDGGIAALPSGMRRVLADMSWILAVQYYGGRRRDDPPGYPRLGGLVEGALRLDPELRPAALVGSLLLAEPPPFGAGEPERADGILADWVRRHPTDFDAALMRGLLQTWHLQDPAEGARILAAAGMRPEAPRWLTAVAARSLAGAGARETARELWRTLLERAEDGRTRSNARTHLLQLDALDRLDELNAAVRRYEERSGRRPGGWRDLVAAGLLPDEPLDPVGIPFVLDPSGAPGIARTSPLSGYPGR